MTFEELPDLMTIEEPAKFLRISRGLAYALARQFLASGGRAGLSVIKLGRRRLVPKCQLARLLSGELTLQIDDSVPKPARPTPTKRTRRAASQLTLPDQPSAS